MENRVRVQHFRVGREIGGMPMRYFRGHGFDVFHTEEPDERGGETEAHVEIDGQTFWGRAECSVKDSFCYRTGRQIAVGRLRKQLEEAGYTITADGMVEPLRGTAKSE